MKIAISVPDDLFKAADTVARKLRKSRSQLYAEAMAAYLGVQGANAIRDKLNEIYAVEDSTPDPALLQLMMDALDPNETW
jgi:metal-responsive CopG/Arc/MetJ family transcriptional regulator